MTKLGSKSDWQLLHGMAFVLFMSCSLLVPSFRQWPWLWLVPLAAYLLLAISVPSLRASLSWFQFGRLSPKTVVATLAATAITAVSLIVFQSAKQPDLRSYIAVLPAHGPGGLIATGAMFTIINATLEELVFRGVLFDAIRSQWSGSVTVIGTAFLFGLGHIHGYPPGPLGAGLAVLFGLALGWLRLWTGGLALPIVVHMGADATIYSIVISSGAV